MSANPERSGYTKPLWDATPPKLIFLEHKPIANDYSICTADICPVSGQVARLKWRWAWHDLQRDDPRGGQDWTDVVINGTD